MHQLRYLLPALLLAGLQIPAASAQDQAAASLDNRVQRLERLLESRSLVQMLERLDAQQRELARLRGALEEAQHELEGLRQRQRELYLDTDRRLSRLEREGGPAAGATGVPQTEQPATAVPQSEAGGGAAPAAPSAADLAAERKAYQAAFDTLRDLRYQDAIAAFTQFLEQYPNGRYAHIAQYWLGEAHYARRQFEPAIAAYQRLVEKHSTSPKVAEALLKIGYSHQELGDSAKARAVLTRLLKEHPDTTEAGQAQNLLKQLGSQGG